MSITREELKVGETYISDNSSTTRKVLFIGNNSLFTYEVEGGGYSEETPYSINYFIKNNSPLPKPKKRYWLWDMKTARGAIYKNNTYLDYDGYCTNRVRYHEKESLLRRHENEFIDIEVE